MTTTPFISHRNHGNDGKKRSYRFWAIEFRTADGTRYTKSFDSRLFSLEQVQKFRDEKIREVGVMRSQERRGAREFPEEFADHRIPIFS